jgi:hypothetical protein
MIIVVVGENDLRHDVRQHDDVVLSLLDWWLDRRVTINDAAVIAGKVRS